MVMVMMKIMITATTVLCTVGKQDGKEEDLTWKPWVR